MDYKIKINAEPADVIKTYSGEFTVDDSTYNFYLTDYSNGTIEVDFIDEEALEEVLLDYEIKELPEKIINKYKHDIRA